MEKSIICKNGVPVHTYKNDSLHSFHISLFIKAGSMYEKNGECGITHFFEHSAIRNVNKLMGDSLYTELDRRALEFNASTYSEMVQFYTGGACESFEFCASLITKIFEPIVLERAGVDAERRRIKAEIRESDDKSSLTSLASSTVHEGTSLASSILGTLATVDKITAKRLEEYRRRITTKDNCFFYVTGSFTDGDIEYLKKEIERYALFDGEAHGNVAPVSAGFFKRSPDLKIKSSDSCSVRFTFDVDGSRVSVPVCDLLYDILFNGYGSPLFVKLSEEEGLFYDITPSSERYKNIGNLAFSFEVKEKDIYRAVELAAEILSRFKSTTLDECDLMKSGYVKNAPILLDDARELAFTFAYDNYVMDLGYSSVDERAARYDAVSAEDIRAGACEIFKLSNLTLTVKGHKNKISADTLLSILKNKL